jgi:hypothetical protein
VNSCNVEITGHNRLPAPERDFIDTFGNQKPVPIFGAEMSRTARRKRSSLNLRCVSHSYFLETVNFSPVFLNIE